MCPTFHHRRPNSEDVAREAGVSRATVSYILNNRPHVSIPVETRERVHAAARKLGYRPNQSARTLATGRTGFVSLWLWGERLQGAYQASFAHYMQSEMEKHPYQLIVHFANYHTVDLGRAKMFEPWHADGIISHEAGPAIEAQLGAECFNSIPIVSTGAYNWLEGTDRVGVDFMTGAREAVEHLVASGRKRIAYLTDNLPSRTDDSRYQQYTSTIEAAGLKTEYIGLDVATRAAAREQMRAYITEKGGPEAVFCHNDELAIGTYRGIRDLGLRIPEDIAIVGCDGIEETEYLDTPISTVVQPYAQMCALAWNFLERRMSDPTGPRQEIWLPTRMVVRESSRF